MTVVLNVSSPTQASAIRGLLAFNQIYPQSSMHAIPFQHRLRVGQASYQAGLAFERAGLNSVVNEQHRYIDPSLLYQHHYSYSSAQPAAGSTSTTVSQAPATPIPTVQPPGSPAPRQGHKFQCDTCGKIFD